MRQDRARLSETAGDSANESERQRTSAACRIPTGTTATDTEIYSPCKHSGGYTPGSRRSGTDPPYPRFSCRPQESYQHPGCALTFVYIAPYLFLVFQLRGFSSILTRSANEPARILCIT